MKFGDLFLINIWLPVHSALVAKLLKERAKKRLFSNSSVSAQNQIREQTFHNLRHLFLDASPSMLKASVQVQSGKPHVWRRKCVREPRKVQWPLMVARTRMTENQCLHISEQSSVTCSLQKWSMGIEPRVQAFILLKVFHYDHDIQTGRLHETLKSPCFFLFFLFKELVFFLVDTFCFNYVSLEQLISINKSSSLRSLSFTDSTAMSCPKALLW